MNKRNFLILLGSIAIAIFLKNSLNNDPLRDLSVPPSFPVFIGMVALSEVLKRLADYIVPPYIKVMNDYAGMYRTQVLFACSRLGISEIVKDEPKSIDDIAKIAQVENTDNLLRLLRAAEAMGYYQEDLKLRLWTNTAYSHLLGSYHVNSLKYLLGTFVEDGWEMWGNLYDSIKYDPPQSQYDIIHGQSLWDTFAKDNRRREQFAKAMSNADSVTWYSQVHDYDWSKYSRFIDIGGSLGSFTAHILEAYPDLRGVVFDLPDVIDQTEISWGKYHSNISSRVHLHRGSFFDGESFPSLEDGDVLSLRNILHDWNDTTCITILSNIRQAIGTKHVTLAIVDIVIEPHDLIAQKYIIDLHMHVFAKGRERYKTHFQSLLEQTGFRLESITTTRTIHSIVTASTIDIKP